MVWVAPRLAARLLGVDSRTISRMGDRGEIATMKLPSGHRRFALADVQALAALSSPSVETSAASARGGDVHDTAGARSDTGRVALPRPVSEPTTRTSGVGAASLRAGVGLHH